MIVKPPQKVNFDNYSKYIFLAGSIENGQACRWQDEVEKELDGEDICILNPRRDNWNSDWKQDIKNKQFRKQVEWELNCQERADLILMYFDPATKSPITLLELGLFARNDYKEIIVCCPEGFWRKGNVDIVCERYGIEQAKDLKQMIRMAK